MHILLFFLSTQPLPYAPASLAARLTMDRILGNTMRVEVIETTFRPTCGNLPHTFWMTKMEKTTEALENLENDRGLVSLGY